MHRAARAVAAAALAATVACGGGSSTGPATSRNNAGTGSLTLSVTAEIDASTVPGGFSTDYLVSVRDNAGRPVSGATVAISNPTLGRLVLPETVAGSGEYLNARLGFPSADFRLDVTRGADNVTGVIVGGPSVHTITAPTNGAVMSANQPLTVSWTVASAAKAAILETRDFGPIVLADNGKFVIAGANNPPNSSQRIRVKRYNEVDIAGGLPGSRMRVIVENEVDPVNVR